MRISSHITFNMQIKGFPTASGKWQVATSKRRLEITSGEPSTQRASEHWQLKRKQKWENRIFVIHTSFPPLEQISISCACDFSMERWLVKAVWGCGSTFYLANVIIIVRCGTLWHSEFIYIIYEWILGSGEKNENVKRLYQFFEAMDICAVL